MATLAQIRGMLLEEALLYLLRASGYDTVLVPGSDPTLYAGGSGLEVRGRGGIHQIDAVADFMVIPPFSHPLRLFVEAKCLEEPVGLPLVRNAVGVFKDVGEYWVCTPTLSGTIPKGRYHYQYAIFSASGYTRDAERYAFAQDIYLIPLEKSLYMARIIAAIRSLDYSDFNLSPNHSSPGSTQSLRSTIRHGIADRDEADFGSSLRINASNTLDAFFDAVRNVHVALMGVLGKRLPVFLVASPGLDLNDLDRSQMVRIVPQEEGYILQSSSGKDLFSFDIPPALFKLYEDHGLLSKEWSIDLKAEVIWQLKAFARTRDQIRSLTLEVAEQSMVEIQRRASEELRRKPASH
ncbi:MAG TPA: hypothetical protein VKY74_09550 [Chloroflexia bacterium]|nr:hypothetical protein [Chloroflexia bacterium]